MAHPTIPGCPITTAVVNVPDAFTKDFFLIEFKKEVMPTICAWENVFFIINSFVEPRLSGQIDQLA
jgi:hypothetical protein